MTEVNEERIYALYVGQYNTINKVPQKKSKKEPLNQRTWNVTKKEEKTSTILHTQRRASSILKRKVQEQRKKWNPHQEEEKE